MKDLSRLTHVAEDGLATYSRDELVRIAQDPRSPHTRAMAAGWIIRARELGWAKNGLPLANRDLESLLDRTVGKPRASLEITTRREPATPGALVARILELALADPGAARDLLLRLQGPEATGQAPSALPPAPDTEPAQESPPQTPGSPPTPARHAPPTPSSIPAVPERPFAYVPPESASADHYAPAPSWEAGPGLAGVDISHRR